MPRVFYDATSVELSTFIEAWNGELERLRARTEVAESIQRVRSITATLDVERGAGSIRHIVARFVGTGAEGSEHFVALLHRELSPLARPIDPNDIRREERVLRVRSRSDASSDDETNGVRLSGRYGLGTIVFLALELESPILQCPIRLHSERRVIE